MGWWLHPPSREPPAAGCALSGQRVCYRRLNQAAFRFVCIFDAHLTPVKDYGNASAFVAQPLGTLPPQAAAGRTHPPNTVHLHLPGRDEPVPRPPRPATAPHNTNAHPPKVPSVPVFAPLTWDWTYL